MPPAATCSAGATTIWENWSGGSHIHDTLISIGVVGDLTFARTRYRSIHGTILSDWRIENGELHLDLTVPAGTTATVLMPEKDGRKPINVESGRHQFVSKLR